MRLILTAAALALSGCVATGPLVTSAARAPQAIAVSDAQVTVVGPAGYCIDKAASRDSRAGAFVVLGGCRALSQAGKSTDAGVLLASFAEPGGAQISNRQDALRTYFRTPAGRAALSRSGRADSVHVLETRAEGDVLFLRVEDSAAPGVPGTDSAYWRAMFDVKGRIATISVLGFADAPQGRDRGLTLARSFAQRLIAANRA